ncbi:MAG: A/G-specific adenine glycosylase [Pseudomonadota bacterium]
MSAHIDSPAQVSPAELLLTWYDRHARSMPWRVPPQKYRNGVRPNPYHVWLSEVMLQQTQVATVADYFLKFLKNWPTLDDLAAAESEDVMRAWAGLGYYARARNLKKCAETVIREYGGEFPQTAEELKKLPGIGEYTSAAIAAIAFDEPVAVVDGNVERVMSRVHELTTPLPKVKTEIRSIVQDAVPKNRPGDFAQAMMDLGATICTPKRPACILCPLESTCRGYASGSQELFPFKAAKQKKPVRTGAAFVAIDHDGAVFLQRRPDSGLLGGMSGVPTTEWTSEVGAVTDASNAPFSGDWEKAGKVRHTFTHFHLELTVWRAEIDDSACDSDGRWSNQNSLPEEALPTVMKKVIALAIPDIF